MPQLLSLRIAALPPMALGKGGSMTGLMQTGYFFSKLFVSVRTTHKMECFTLVHIALP